MSAGDIAGLAIESYRPEMYPYIEYMWETHDSASPPLEMFKEGWIVGRGNMPISAIFVYDTGTPMCMLEFMVCNAKAPKILRNTAIEMMLKQAIDYCDKKGYKYIYTATGSTKFKKRLENNDFIGKSSGQTHMFRGL